jgi:hypothetical protein
MMGCRKQFNKGQAMQWIKCSDRLPTEADGDSFNDVVVKAQGDALVLMRWDRIDKEDGEWLAGACEREGGGSK